MPYVLPRSATPKNDLVFILAFGDLSYLELSSLYGHQASDLRRPWEDIAFGNFAERPGSLERLAGVHKVATAITNGPAAWAEAADRLETFLESFDSDFNFSVSLYTPDPPEKQEYEELLSAVLSSVRDAGFRKANLVRARDGTEVPGRDVISRNLLDFVVIRLGEEYWVGATSFVPDTEEFLVRSKERPVVSSEISISSRLARLLLNLAGVKKGDLLLDPFCGAGTIIAEAVTLGANCIGVDRSRNRIENTKRNLEWLSRALGQSDQTCSLVVGDAMRLERVLGDTVVDKIVTEPILLPRLNFAPNVDRAKKMIRSSSALYSEALYSMSGAIKRGGRIVIVTPSLRTDKGRDISVVLENLEEVGLRPFRFARSGLEYPIRISHENTRWIRRLVYVLERA